MIKIVSLIILLISGLIWRTKIINAKDFDQKINNKFFIKYVILALLIIEMIFISISYIFLLYSMEIAKPALISSVLFNIVFMLWVFIYERTNIYYNV